MCAVSLTTKIVI